MYSYVPIAKVIYSFNVCYYTESLHSLILKDPLEFDPILDQKQKPNFKILQNHNGTLNLVFFS